MPAAANGHVHLDHFEVLAQGKLETVRPDAPVEEGATIELKLVEVGLHDPTAGVGKLDGGYEVVVARRVEARRQEGEGDASDARSRALPSRRSPTTPSPPPTPITFEAEAEKPMRASRSKKDVELVEADELDEPDEPEDADAAIEEDEAEPAPGEVVADADGQPKKKRTRRGTRGGRSRKKPAATAAASADDGVDVPADESNGRPAPRIHVPPSDLAATVVVPEPATDAGADAAEPEAGQLPRTGRSARTVCRSASARDVGRAAARSAASPPQRARTTSPPADEAGAERSSGRRRASGVRSDVRVDRRLRLAIPRLAAIMRRPCGPPARHDLTK